MNPVCSTCHGPLTTYDEESSTCVGYFQEEGHDHDPNCQRREFYCAEGHRNPIAIVRTCPTEGCDWQGKSECFCVPRFVRTWPAVPQRCVPPFERGLWVISDEERVRCLHCQSWTMLDIRNRTPEEVETWFAWVHTKGCATKS